MLSEHHQYPDEATTADLVGRMHFSGATDRSLFLAVNKVFGPITVDLAATADDRMVAEFISPADDTFTVSWLDRIGDGVGWLNPPSGDLAPWAVKMTNEAQRGARFCALLPLSLDTDWCWQLTAQAHISVLTPRMCYDGLPIPLAIFTFNLSAPGMDRWHWRDLQQNTP